MTLYGNEHLDHGSERDRGTERLRTGRAGFVWVRNYRRFKAPLVLGLLAFAAVRLVENAAGINFFLDGDAVDRDTFAQQFVAVLRGLPFLALAVLTDVTWQ
ncbi:hypothetical protein [Halorientalis salina]|uniref:hypothetical protein n=1 Tax=Halorientalis salina TaxID=2932266 RepID=UPI002022B3E4|nr:hypothetical protein [Halorientalis salina]